MIHCETNGAGIICFTTDHDVRSFSAQTHLHESSREIILWNVPTVFVGQGCAPEETEPTQPATDAAEANGRSGLSSLVSTTISEASHIGSEVSTATDEALKAVGRVSVAGVRLLMKLWGGVSQTTAAAGNALATGVKQVNKYTKPVPVIGTVTTGVENVVAGVADTYSDNSKFNRARRDRLAEEWLGQVNKFTPGTAKPAAAAAGADAEPASP